MIGSRQLFPDANPYGRTWHIGRLVTLLCTGPLPSGQCLS